MQKIILAIEAGNLATSTLDFACYIANLTKSKLTGAFLENTLHEEMAELSKPLDREDALVSRKARIENNITNFKNGCENRGVIACVHHDRGLPVSELIEESRFSDLLILDAGLSFKNKYESTPSGFSKEIFEKAECPVMIAPQHFDEINTIVFFYDGSHSAMLAIKVFTMQFPQLSNKKIIVVEVAKPNQVAISNKYKLMEWLNMHYTNIDVELLHGIPKDELLKYVLQKKKLLLVAGAFGRNVISSFLKKSTASLMLGTTDLPLFISHQ